MYSKKADSINLKQWSKSTRSQLSLSSIFKIALNVCVEISNKSIGGSSWRPIRQDIHIHPTKLYIISVQKQENQISPTARQQQQTILWDSSYDSRTFTTNLIATLINGDVIISSYQYLKSKPQLQVQEKQVYDLFMKYKQFHPKDFPQKLTDLVTYYEKKQKKSNQKNDIDYLVDQRIQYINKKIQQLQSHPNKIQQYQKLCLSFETMNKEILQHWKIKNAIGVLYQLANNPTKAEHYYKQAYRLQSNNPIIISNQANLYFKQNNKHSYPQKINELAKFKGKNVFDDNQFFEIEAENETNNEKKISMFQTLKKTATKRTEKWKYEMKIAEVEYRKYKEKSYERLSKLQSQIEMIQNQSKPSTSIRSSNYNDKPKGFQSSQNVSKTFSNQVLEQPLTPQQLQLNEINNINLLLLKAEINQSQIKLLDVNLKLNQNPQSKHYSKLKADILMKENQYKEARQIYIEIQRHYADDYDFNWNLGKCYYELESLECFQYFKNCYEINASKKSEIVKMILKMEEYYVKIKAFGENMRKSNDLLEGDKNKALDIVKEAREFYEKK